MSQQAVYIVRLQSIEPVSVSSLHSFPIALLYRQHDIRSSQRLQCRKHDTSAVSCNILHDGNVIVNGLKIYISAHIKHDPGNPTAIEPGVTVKLPIKMEPAVKQAPVFSVSLRIPVVSPAVSFVVVLTLSLGLHGCQISSTTAITVRTARQIIMIFWFFMFSSSPALFHKISSRQSR